MKLCTVTTIVTGLTLINTTLFCMYGSETDATGIMMMETKSHNVSAANQMS